MGDKAAKRGKGGFSYELRFDQKPTVILGRDPRCEIRLGANSVHASRVHCGLFARQLPDGGSVIWEAIDLNSNNGTFLNGHELGHREKRLLRDRDQIVLGPGGEPTTERFEFRLDNGKCLLVRTGAGANASATEHTPIPAKQPAKHDHGKVLVSPSSECPITSNAEPTANPLIPLDPTWVPVRIELGVLQLEQGDPTFAQLRERITSEGLVSPSLEFAFSVSPAASSAAGSDAARVTVLPAQEAGCRLLHSQRARGVELQLLRPAKAATSPEAQPQAQTLAQLPLPPAAAAASALEQADGDAETEAETEAPVPVALNLEHAGQPQPQAQQQQQQPLCPPVLAVPIPAPSLPQARPLPQHSGRQPPLELTATAAAGAAAGVGGRAKAVRQKSGYQYFKENNRFAVQRQHGRALKQHEYNHEADWVALGAEGQQSWHEAAVEYNRRRTEELQAQPAAARAPKRTGAQAGLSAAPHKQHATARLQPPPPHLPQLDAGEWRQRGRGGGASPLRAMPEQLQFVEDLDTQAEDASG